MTLVNSCPKNSHAHGRTARHVMANKPEREMFIRDTGRPPRLGVSQSACQRRQEDSERLSRRLVWKAGHSRARRSLAAIRWETETPWRTSPAYVKTNRPG